MKRAVRCMAVVLVMTTLGRFGPAPIRGVAGLIAPRAMAADTSTATNPCAAPNETLPSISETAWRVLVAATCPVNANKYPFVAWETWIEQSQLYPTDVAAGLVPPNARTQAVRGNHVLHGSPLALLRNPNLRHKVPGLLGGADQDCNKAAAPPPGEPNIVICEEVRENGAAQDYIAGTGLWNRFGQMDAAEDHRNIQFPRPSVEIKADWIELTSIGYTCGALPKSLTSTVHVETINGSCFALAGMHVISKLLDQWIWATFEPQNAVTNPNRCKVLGCKDGFGSEPPVSDGENTKLTPALRALMRAANLAPEFYNYRLDNWQTDFFKPKLLGNSIIEGENAGVPLTQSSCMSCHAVSSVKADGTDGLTLLTTNPVGLPAPLPSKNWIRRDFVWSMFLACPHNPIGTCAK